MIREVFKAGPPYIFRFRGNTDRTIDEIVNNYIFFPDRNSLNDPYDSSHELVYLTKNPEATNELFRLVSKSITDIEVKRYFESEYSSDKLQKFANQRIENFILEFGIACFSMYIMNLPLWANYANNHKGVCLQFNSDIDKDFFSVLGPVFYEDNLNPLEFSPILSEKDIGKIFFRKGKNWEYEKEIRLLNDFKGKAKFDKCALRNVILGYNADNEYVVKVVSAVKKNYRHVGVYQMEKPTKINKFTLIKIG